MQKELTMLICALGGYIIMANINDYLDRAEQEQDAQEEVTDKDQAGERKKTE